MDKYFWIETLIPVFFLVVVSLFSQNYLKKRDKRGYHFGFGLAFLGLILMLFTWIIVMRIASQIQCQTAYGEMASDPKMCDNPGEGLLVLIQVPVLVIAWFIFSILNIYKLRPLKRL